MELSHECSTEWGRVWQTKDANGNYVLDLFERSAVLAEAVGA